MNPTTKNPQLTTRRVDGFTPIELRILRWAAEQPDGIVLLVSSKVHSDYFLAAYYLQRLGYLWPTSINKPDIAGSFLWKLQDEGRAALAILNRAEAA